MLWSRSRTYVGVDVAPDNTVVTLTDSIDWECISTSKSHDNLLANENCPFMIT